jgi:homeobox protein cut-like
LETQISELEAESSRLLRVIDVQKEAATSAEQSARRRLDEAIKDLASRVGSLIAENNLNLIVIFLQNSELETFKNKLRQYQDYDEIKRELEIMKVSSNGTA